ncbi:hypothetical protein TrCOL_g11962 [Triparma columacea]|uniref:DUF1995 domain-containing protein n=1 Tax=Triparma columacea TaxID=722753 RepID=A0A9W7FVV7_9STRA|nr:hypothetical protein TrCOL_g11962 [Triparma columacea]
MVANAATSITTARTSGLSRQTVSIIIPELPTVGPADLDPWPGGTRQMSREAQPLIESLLKLVTGCDSVSSTMLDSESGAMQFVGEGETAADDVCVLAFADIESFPTLMKLDEDCGERLMILINPQFNSVADFSLFARGRAKSYFGDTVLTDKFPYSFCLQEQAVRSEDCKIVYNAGVGWGAFALTDSTYEGMNMVDAGDSMPLHDKAETEKPTYQWIEERLNKKLPDPIFIRKIKEAKEKLQNN